MRFQGLILDGRNRFAACELAGVEPKFEDFEGTEYEALRKVISLNLHRRHLNESQRAMVGARIATLGPGGDQRSDHSANWRNGMTAAEASDRAPNYQYGVTNAEFSVTRRAGAASRRLC